MVFDEAGRLNFRVGSPALQFAFVVCDLAGQCWISNPGHPDPIEFVLPNRK